MTDPRSDELTAFAEECGTVEQTLRSIPEDLDLAAAPGLGDWPLRTLLGHLVGVAARLDRYAEAGTTGAVPAVDRSSYFVASPAAQSPVRAATAEEDAGAVGDTPWHEAFSQAWRASANRMVALSAGPAPVRIHTAFGVMDATEYLATRVAEVTIHHMDVRVALDQPPAPTALAARLTSDLLEGILRLDDPSAGKPHGLGRTRFILMASGRIASQDPRYPLLS